MKKERLFIRNFEAGSYLETFFITAVAAILVIRAFLKLTGYPKLGGEKLHLAHVLWGGLFMLMSILIFLVFLGKWRERLAAVVGGVGFGYFIDEVGKFITSDNDYFFKPSVAVMYLVFILIFVAIRSIQTGRHHTRLEYLINAVRELEEIAVHELDEEEKSRILFYLSKSRTDHPLVSPLRKVVGETEALEVRSFGFIRRWKSALTAHYRRIAGTRWFHLGIVVFFLVQLLVSVSYVVVLVFFRGLGWAQILHIGIFDRIALRLQGLSFIDWAELASSLISAVFIFLGILFLARNRWAALRMFERSILISIFLTQVFIFYRQQFAALLGLAFNLLILAALRFMLEKEEANALSRV
ncbi:MAG: hypothetical protein WBC70_01795 [Candidatus Aminicenantales bacterium]